MREKEKEKEKKKEGHKEEKKKHSKKEIKEGKNINKEFHKVKSLEISHSSSAKAAKEFPWIEYSQKEIEEFIVKLANEGHSKSEIGAILRDQYGIPSVKKFVRKSISEVLAENKFEEEIPEDLLNLIKRSVMLEKHSEKNRKDFTAKRGYQLTVSKINRLVKYYRGKGKLPKDWRFSAETARLLVK